MTRDEFERANEIERLRKALRQVDGMVRWLCGEEGSFGDEPDPHGKYGRPYWWRTELRKRYAAIQAAIKEQP